MTRRTILLTALGVGLYQKPLHPNPLYPEMSNEDYDAWQEVERTWNPFAAKLYSGVFDLKLWHSARKALQRVGVCEK